MSSSDDSEVDRISELPEPLISDILSLLPTKTAFATSFVSKAWKLHWTKVTAFDFDDDRYRNCFDYEEFVNRVLINHTGEFIDKFRLRSKFSYISYTNIWAEAALSRHVKVLDLNVCRRKIFPAPNSDQFEVLTLPSSLYTCKTLEVLRLRGHFKFRLVPVVCLPKLVVLHLEKVSYESDDCVQKLLSGSPMLQSLAFEMPIGPDCTIHSPTLKHLQVYNCKNCIDLYYFNEENIFAPALERISVFHDDTSVEISILQCRTSANEVHAHLSCTGRYSCFGFPLFYINIIKILEKATRKQLSESLEITTKLVVQFHYVYWDCLMDLLHRCDNLEALEISYVSSEDDWSDPVWVPECVKSSLKEVGFRTFCHTQDEKNMLHWILEHGLVLQRVDLRRKSEIMSKAYPSCEIIL